MISLLDGLISYWRLNEKSGTRFDSRGSNDLTDNNTVGFATGKNSNAADFEADNNEHLNIADNASLRTGNIDFTFAGWVMLESKGANRAILGKFDTAAQLEYIIRFQNATDRIQFHITHDGATVKLVAGNNFGSPPLDTWIFVVVWHDSTADTINIQINNGTADSAAHATGVFAGTSTFAIGSSGMTQTLWDGLVDEIGFWKRLLTTDEKTALYNGGDGITYPFISNRPRHNQSLLTGLTLGIHG